MCVSILCYINNGFLKQIMIVSRRFSFSLYDCIHCVQYLRSQLVVLRSSSDHSYRLRLTSRWFSIRCLRATQTFATMVWQFTPQNVENILLVIPLSGIFFWCGKGIVWEGVLTDLSDWIYLHIFH